MTAHNDLRRALERGEPVVGASVATFSPTIVETLGNLDFDYVWLDFEHGGPSPYDSTIFENLTRAADVSEVELLVRLPSIEPALIRKVLDAGVRTILVPRVETATQVRHAVEAAHFSYDGSVGNRGVGVGRASRWAGDIQGYVDREDDEVLVGTMVENARAVANLEEILAVPDLGFVFLGPSDLSVSLGHPLEKDHPDVHAALERTRVACLDAGVPIGCIQNDAADARAAVEDGFQILRIGGDLGAIRAVLSARLENVRR